MSSGKSIPIIPLPPVDGAQATEAMTRLYIRFQELMGNEDRRSYFDLISAMPVNTLYDVPEHIAGNVQ